MPQLYECQHCRRRLELDDGESHREVQCPCGQVGNLQAIKTDEEKAIRAAGVVAKGVGSVTSWAGRLMGRAAAKTGRAIAATAIEANAKRAEEKIFLRAVKRADFIAIDFETANYQRSSACQIGVAIFRGGQCVAKRSSLLKPIPDDFNHEFIAIHGITPSDVAHASTFADIWNQWLGAVIRSNNMMVAHNASFDRGVLEAAAETHGIILPACRFECTLAAAHDQIDAPSYGLGTLSRMYGIDMDHHDAEADAVACGHLAEALRSGRPPLATAPQLYLTDEGQAALSGRTVVITGETTMFDRKTAEQLIKQAGGKVRSAVSGRTEIVIVGQKVWDAYKRCNFVTKKLSVAMQRVEAGQLSLVEEQTAAHAWFLYATPDRPACDD